MSYYAKYDGHIRLKNPTEEVLETVQNTWYSSDIETQKEASGVLWIGLGGYESINTDEIEDALRGLLPYTHSGYIEYVGEDESCWKYEFKNGRWTEYPGYITCVYDEKGGWEI